MKPACCLSEPELTKISKQDIFIGLPDHVTGNSWIEGLFGIEKENIRIDKSGRLSQTPHPDAFGNKLKHPYITTDFSESQIEMRTPPLADITESLGFLETIHDIVSLELTDEYLWPQSIPPVLPDDELIPIAQYDQEGKDARQYRELLAQKYGPKNQMFSGIHFNLSFGEKLMQTLYYYSNTSLTYDDFRDEVYLKTIRQILRLRWIYILLYGNSPVADSSLELKCKLDPYRTDKQVIGLSLRNSCFGYRNIGELYPDYSSVQNFRKSIDKMISGGTLASPKELYSPVRPKFVKDPSHISYIELRFLDIDPLSSAGVTKEALYFLHALALYGLLSEEPDAFDQEAQTRANQNHGYAALYGLHADLFNPESSDQQINLWIAAEKVLEKVTVLFSELKISQPEYGSALERTSALIKDPGQRGVHTVLSGILESGYIPFHLAKAHEYLAQSQQNSYQFRGLEDMELSTQLLLREAVKRGVIFEILDRKENFVRFTQSGNIQFVKQATKTSLDNYASILTMENKLVTKKILEEAGIIVPKGSEYTVAEKAKSDFDFFKGKAVVVKPNQTNFGIGITILKENTDEQVFRRAVDIAFEHDSTILIEEFIEGKEFRIFVIGEEVVGILHRIPANIAGDGSHSIRELIEIKNEDPLRGKGYRTPLEKIQLGEAEEMFLILQQKDFEYVPSKGEIVYLRENSNISTGGDSIDFTDDIPVSYKEIAVKAAAALQVKITGLDMIIRDYRQEADPSNYAIIEMNFNPAIHIHCHPYKGKNRKLNEKLMNALGFPKTV
jgi:glutamate--cysteine ligase